MTLKPHHPIKGTDVHFGCVQKAVELTSGDLLCVANRIEGVDRRFDPAAESARGHKVRSSSALIGQGLKSSLCAR